METVRVGRRDVLRGGAALFGTSVLGAAAGCVEQEPATPVPLPELLNEPEPYTDDRVRTRGFAELESDDSFTTIVMAGKVPVTQYHVDLTYELHVELDTEAEALHLHDTGIQSAIPEDLDEGDLYRDELEVTGTLKYSQADERYQLEAEEIKKAPTGDR